MARCQQLVNLAEGYISVRGTILFFFFKLLKLFKIKICVGVPTVAHWVNDPTCLCGGAGGIPDLAPD